MKEREVVFVEHACAFCLGRKLGVVVDVGAVVVDVGAVVVDVGAVVDFVFAVVVDVVIFIFFFINCDLGLRVV